MYRNIYKANWVVVSDEEKHIIDSNSRIADRIEEHEALRRKREREAANYGGSEDGEPEFVGGLDYEAVDAILEDGEEQSGGNVIKAGAEQIDLDEVKAQAQEIIDAAQAEAEQIREAARQEGEALRQKTLADADKRGYDEGYQRGFAEADEMKQALAAEKAQIEEEYGQLLDELEPRFVDAITSVYSHIFGVDLIDNRDILVHLIDSTLRKVESSRTFIVHVSGEDYPYINMQKQTLTEGAINGKGLIEIIEDITLGKGECLIETDGGIFDCGIGTQLEELTKKLQVLSFDGSNG